MKAICKVLIVISILVFINTLTTYVYADSSEEGITVYLTMSEDGDFITGNEGTVLASVPIKVDYFDLAEYGLEKYCCFDDEGEIVEQPTMLHMLIRATEQYYIVGKLASDDINSKEKIMNFTGSPGSLYLKYFWGHDENLLYHVNDEYPEESPGWGATLDTILLDDGDTVDLAMFTGWGISSTGAFAFFREKQFNIGVGEDIVLEGDSNSGILSGTDIQKSIMNNTELRVSRDDGYTWSKAAAVTNKEGWAGFIFNEPGRYLVSAGPEYPEYEQEMNVDYRCVAPPIAVINVTGEALPPLSVSFDTAGGDSVPSQDVIKYDRCKKPDDPTRTGYTFKGWYEDQDLTQEYDFERAVISDLTIYAKWEKNAEPTPTPVNYTPGKVKLRSVKAGKKKLTIKWKKVSKASGYKVQVRVLKQKGVKKTSKWKTYKVGAKTFTKTVRKLRSGKLYQVRVRAYRKASGKNYLGKWSKTYKVKTK